MPHPSHYLKTYRDSDNVWVTYCFKCSAESDTDLAKECPGEYVSRTTAYPGTQLQGEKLPIDQQIADEKYKYEPSTKGGDKIVSLMDDEKEVDKSEEQS